MIVGVVQARLSSSRLPGKVLETLHGAPMIVRQLERIQRSQRMDKVVVATSDLPQDDAIEGACASVGVACHRGSLENVLDRFARAAAAEGADVVVRLTADCPLADPAVIDDLITFFEAGGYDYASNTLTPTWPDGLDAEVMTMAALNKAHMNATMDAEKEHVTPYLYGHADQFKLGSFEQSEDLSALRWTVDYPEDLDFVRAVYAALYRTNPAFTTADVLALLDSCEMDLRAGSGERSGPASVLAAEKQ